MFQDFWKNKNVLLTGHTGFKGGWLSLWLQSLGAKVHGYALEPSTQPNFFSIADVVSGMESHTIADIRDNHRIQNIIDSTKPEIVFHMASQPLVRRSYDNPCETYSTNIMGVVNLLEAIRNSSSVRAVLNVTSDKCYENFEKEEPYAEDEALGGHDPYSSSKACSEIITAAYRKSFLASKGVGVATARAGNVIGGGDWSEDRLIPDFFRAITKNQPLIIRSPTAIRPWQHVLDPLNGYLNLAERLYEEPVKFSSAWNFGPSKDDAKTVSWLLTKLVEKIPNATWKIDNKLQLHEANLLKLDISKASAQLNWTPRWNLNVAINKTVEWQYQFDSGANLKKYTLIQIADYMSVKK